MNFFKKIGTWIKSHVLVTLIIGIIAVGGVATSLLLFNNNVPKLDSDNYSNDNVSDVSDDKPTSNTLSDGTYSCQLMYNGKSLDSDKSVEDWSKKLYESITGATVASNIDISEMRQMVDSFKKYYVIKNANILTVGAKEENADKKIFSYDLGHNQFIKVGEDAVTEAMTPKLQKLIEVKQTKDSLTFDNFIFLTLYWPKLYSNSMEDSELIKLPGDLVCTFSSEEVR